MNLGSLLRQLLRQRPAPRHDTSAGPAPVAMPSRTQPPTSSDTTPFVAFVTLTNEVRLFSKSGDGFSPLASVRLRILAPAHAIAKEMRVMFVPLQVFAEDPSLSALGRAHAVVLGKLSTGYLLGHRAEITGLLERLAGHARGPRLFADLSDDYAAMGAMLGEPFLADYQAALAGHCSLTVPCEAMAERLRPHAKHGVHVIEDAWESPRVNAPRAPRSGPVRLCWFGNLGDTNVAHVDDSLAQVAARLRGRPAALTIVAGHDRAHLVDKIAARARREHPELEVASIPWSPENTWRAIDDCDIVLLPQDFRSDWGRAKSHNRLVEALRGGRLAVASPTPAYVELQDFAWVGESLADGVDWALAHPQSAADRIAAGQAHIASRFSPQAAGGRWVEVLGAAAAPSANRPVRLNLGCGDKVLAGYVNVDEASARAGARPDVVCDVRRLEPFADASADEVMAIHVVEHFWRWEVADVLREWVRVLKPGGRMVLECPNLRVACEELLRDPAAANGTGPEVQRTMWVLYGDPSWRDPLMFHRWNYTPESLAALMREAGLVNVRQEPALFKLRDMRDMRVVGERVGA